MTKPDKNTPKDFLDWLNFRSLPDWTRSRGLGGLVATLLALLFITALVALVGILLHTIGQSMSPDSDGPNLGAGALIAAMLGAPFVIWGTWLKHRTVTFQKEGHITDRINKAVEMLGAEKTVKKLKKDKSGSVEVTVPNIEVRIGAILSLERIAQDSTAYDKGRDHVRVMEILCAYVRENSNARKPVDFPEPEWVPLADGASAESRKKHLAERQRRFGEMFFESLAWKWAQALPKPRADVDQAMKVLGRRTAIQRKVEAAWPNPPTDDTIWPFDKGLEGLPEKEDGEATTTAEIDAFKTRLAAWKQTLADYGGYRIDLRGANLQGADLSRAVLSGAKLSETRMEGGNLHEAKMKGTDLSEAKLHGAYFVAAMLDGADLSETRMEAVDMSEAQLRGANLSFAGLNGANLYNARIMGAIMTYAVLERGNLQYAHLKGAYLVGAKIEAANFRKARMEAANLAKTRIISSTNLGSAVVNGAALWSKDYSKASLSQEQIDQMFGDGSVTLPEGLTRPAHWPDRVLSWGTFRAEWRKWQADPEGYVPPPYPAEDPASGSKPA